MVPLPLARASARATDPSHIKEHWAAVSEPDTGRSFYSCFLRLASCFLFAVLAISAAVLGVRFI